MSYDFDASLVKLPIVTVAQPGQIAINNLTSVPLKEKLVTFCMYLKLVCILCCIMYINCVSYSGKIWHEI